jgi:hypothetical protein
MRGRGTQFDRTAIEFVKMVGRYGALREEASCYRMFELLAGPRSCRAPSTPRGRGRLPATLLLMPPDDYGRMRQAAIAVSNRE